MSITKNWDYQPIEYKNQDIEINGYPMYAETITGTEPYPRREWSEKHIMNGTTVVSKGQYIPRQYSFKTSLFVTPEKINIHDKILENMVIEPAEVICPAMGEPFTAMITIKKDYKESTPNTISLDFTIKEIPKTKTKITENRIYEGTSSKIEIEEYTENVEKIIEATKGYSETPKRETIEKEEIKIEEGETIENGGENTNNYEINIQTKN